MKKEVIVAILVGFGLGLIITFGIWTANKALKGTTAPTTKPIEEATTITPTTASTEVTLVVESPEENAISDQEKIEIKGQTIAKAIIVVIYPEGEKILEADEEGKFTTEITLAGGDNEIKISAHDDQGNEASKTLTVVYSTAEI